MSAPYKIADIWKLGAIGKIDDTDPLSRPFHKLLTRLAHLELTLQAVHLYVEGSAQAVGVKGGQIVYGGTASGDALELHSNTSSDGVIKLGSTVVVNEVTGRIGIGVGTGPARMIDGTSAANDLASAQLFL